MKFTTLSRRTAAAGAASALVAGALVGATTTAAQAAPIMNEYTCQGTSAFPVWLNSNLADIDSFDSVAAGFDVPAAFLPSGVTNTLTVPEEVITKMKEFTITRLDSPDFAGSIGTTDVGVDGVGANVADAVDNENGTYSFEADGTNAAFEVPRSGTYDVTSPEAFTIDAKNEAGAVVLQVPCTIKDGTEPGVYGSLTVTKNASTSAAKALNSPVQKGDMAKVKVTVTAPNETPSGKVVLKRGTKTLDTGMLNADGVVKLKFPAKVLGNNKLKTIYKGDGYTKKSTDTVVVKVTR